MTSVNYSSQLDRYRAWFYAAALYNLIWGGFNILFPHLYFDWLGIPRPNYLPLWQVVGMFVLVYAPAYWWAAQEPQQHYHFIIIGLLGKLLGPIGFIWALVSGQLPLAFGWTLLTNDLIWWPAFIAYLHDIYRKDIKPPKTSRRTHAVALAGVSPSQVSDPPETGHSPSNA